MRLPLKTSSNALEELCAIVERCTIFYAAPLARMRVIACFTLLAAAVSGQSTFGFANTFGSNMVWFCAVRCGVVARLTLREPIFVKKQCLIYCTRSCSRARRPQRCGAPQRLVWICMQFRAAA